MDKGSVYPLHLIPLLPIAGAVVNLLFGKRLGKTVVAFVGVLSVALAMLITWHFAIMIGGQADWSAFRGGFFDGDWFYATEQIASRSLHVRAGLVFDRLSAVMCLVITTVGCLIHIYSTEYMKDDEHYNRYFSFLNLFTGSMLILVLGDSLPVTFVGWEGVGLCSYLLIGFWFDKEANAYAGRKAFVVNRIGDFGFLLGMFMIFVATQSLTYSDLASPTSIDALKTPFLVGRASYATFAALLLFVGCTGKSAQIPLYIWLPDAMAGPTPVSALIHAATMVTAGVYMVARLSFLFEIDPFVGAVISVVGAATALFAATMGLTQRPIKKILAYSTVSQLGFMFVGVGTRNYQAGLFHLVTHAFFKACLFLGAGSIMHALHHEEDPTKREDVFAMGAMGKKMPITRITFLVSSLALAGIVPFAGFFSKDAILGGAYAFDMASVPGWPHWLGPALYATLAVAAACTAFYIFRAYFLVFSGDTFRGTGHVYDHMHESPSAMTIPLIVLGVGATLLGFLGIPEIEGHFEHMNRFAEWLPARLGVVHEPEGAMAVVLMGVATVIAFAGVGVAYMFYGNGKLAPQLDGLRNSPVGKLIANLYYVDQLYDRVVVRPLRKVAWFSWKVIDSFFIDTLCVRGPAYVADWIGRALRYVQNGDVQRYVVGVLGGTIVMLILATHWTACSSDSFDVDVQGQDVTVRTRPNAPSSGPLARPLEYDIDFGDGTPAVHQTSPGVAIAHHHYDATGERKISVSVHDPRWKTSAEQSRKVVIK